MFLSDPKSERKLTIDNIASSCAKNSDPISVQGNKINAKCSNNIIIVIYVLNFFFL